MNRFKFGVTLTLCLLLTGLLLIASVNGQTVTPDPIDLTGTALVSSATLTASVADFAAQSAPSGGTATPFMEGLCQSLAFRALDDVAAGIEDGLLSADLPVEAVTVSAIEDTQDCITFDVQRTDAAIALSTSAINDEAAIGAALQATFAVLAVSDLPLYPDIRLTVAFVQGNQQRSVTVGYDADFRAFIDAVADPADLLDAVTFYGQPPAAIG